MTGHLVTPAQIEAFQADGVVLLRGMFTEWVDIIRDGIERSMNAPTPQVADFREGGDAGRFFNDFYRWPVVPEFLELVRRSPAAELAATLTRSTTSQLFHDHVLVKEPGTTMPTPWHQDAAYSFVKGTQAVTLWLPVDPVDEATLRFVAGSHRWPKLVRPTNWASLQDFYADDDAYMATPDIESDPQRYRVLEWPMQPGDVLVFHLRALHSARGNLTTRRRRALSVRFLGDDMRYDRDLPLMVPEFNNHRMIQGQRLREDWFPVMWNGELTYASDARAADLRELGIAAAKQVHAPAKPQPPKVKRPALSKPRSKRWWSKLKKTVRRIGTAHGS